MQKGPKEPNMTEFFHTLPKERIVVVCGNYGSGKTEFCLQLALELAQQQPTTLVDLDIVNPYFRSAEATALLNEGGVDVLAPTFAMSTVDIPALPAEIQRVFVEKERRVVFDVGGDDTGAAALGRYRRYFEVDSAAMYFVVNAFRPLSGDADSVCDLLYRVEQKGSMKASYLINNANVAWESGAQNLARGEELLREVSARTKLPVAYHCGTRPVLEAASSLSLSGQPFEMHIRMRPDWM